MHDSRANMRMKKWMSMLGIAIALKRGASLELKQTEIELTPQASAARSFIWPRFLLERDVPSS
jgi:hypothetical protein